MCMFCKCDKTVPSHTTHVVNYNDCLIVIKNVPCEECVQCGETFFTTKVVKRLDELVKRAKQMLQEISVIDYDKAA